MRAVFPQGHGFPADQALPAPQAEPCPDLAHTRPELTGSASGLGSASGAPEALPRSSLAWPDPAPAPFPPAGWDTTPPPHGPCASTGPFLGGICSLGRPSPAKGPRSSGCWSQQEEWGSEVWQQLGAALLPKPVTPALLPSQPPRRAGREASRQTGVGMGPVELPRLLLGCWPGRKAVRHLDPCGLGPAIALLTLQS